MTDKPTPTVTQADRDAAADLAQWLIDAQREWGDMPQWFTSGFPKACREGVWDNHDWPLAFACHREAHSTAERDGIVAWLRSESDKATDIAMKAVVNSSSERNHIAGAVALRRAADIIERNEHLSQEEAG